MIVTVLRASLLHRTFRKLVYVSFPNGSRRRRSSGLAEVNLSDYRAAAFRDPEAAKDWTEKAAPLERLLRRRAIFARYTAHHVSKVMREMVPLLLFSHICVVQNVLGLSPVVKCLSGEGHFR